MVQLAQDLDVLGQVLRHSLEIALCPGLGLVRRCQVLLCCVHVHLSETDLVVQRLRLELVVLLRARLLLSQGVQLVLRLLAQLLQDVCDRAALALVAVGRRRARLLLVLALTVRRGALHEGCEPVGILEVDGVGLDHGLQDLHQACGARRLHEGCAALPLELTLCASERIEHLHEFLLRCAEHNGLFLPSLGGRLQLSLVLGDRPAQVRDLRGQGLGLGCLLRDVGLQLLDLPLHGLDLVVQLSRSVLALLRHLVVNLLRLLSLRDHLLLHLRQ
mmetsp:Transcript_58874/g.170289  ORF Transcript_58874/g.170289 Transcript_58874/m.170289 type:complete len:274 (+) Transcript_58874:1293-2114(+)